MVTSAPHSPGGRAEAGGTVEETTAVLAAVRAVWRVWRGLTVPHPERHGEDSALRQPRSEQCAADRAGTPDRAAAADARAVPAVGTVVLPHDLVTVPERFGIEAVDVLRRRGLCGAVLHDQTSRTVYFLVPPGTAPTWTVPDTSCGQAAEDGTSGVCRPLDTHCRCWLMAPRRARRLTESAVLRRALTEAARTVTAAEAAPTQQ